MAKIVKKASAKKTVKKAASKKAAGKKVATKKASAKKTTASKKAPVKKTIAKKTATKKVAVKKAPAKKAAPKVGTTLDIKNPLVTAIIDGLEDRKAKNIVVLNLTHLQNRAFDYFVIADAESSTHVSSIASSVEDEVKKKLNDRPFHTEGWQNAEWILLDYVNVVVHVFQQEIRHFYRLEDLWADAEIIKIN